MTLALVALGLAAVPALLFLRNLRRFAPLPPPAVSVAPACSVLIPARDEERNIVAAVRSVLESRGVDLDIIVLDDGSQDQTVAAVNDINDPRVRVRSAAPLAPGWCGKNAACQQLAALARHDRLVFMDADVRVSRPDALARLTRFLDEGPAAMVSGIPRQEVGTLLERLVVPLIHFVLLGFLPLGRMRASVSPAYAAACGQIVAVRREAYGAVGGHGAIRDRVHDAMALAQAFRARGFATDLFDATDTFHCRMYRTGGEVWRGFAKNAHEGLGSARLIGPSTLLLLGGQVLPFILLALARRPRTRVLALMAAGLAYLPRLAAAGRFRQPFTAVWLHPLGVALLVAIQWSALALRLSGRAATWKGRALARP